MILSDNGISRVWREGPWVYKQQPKFFCDNEEWCLRKLWAYDIVPFVERVDIEIIRTKFIDHHPITPALFMRHYQNVLDALKNAGIRHGDLTEYAVIPHRNKPFLIDFAESRLVCDPRPDKRREGDSYWLKRTMEKLCEAAPNS